VARRTIPMTVHLSPEVDGRLRLLATRTGRAVDDLLHEATELLLARYRDHLPEQLTWPVVAAPSPDDR
jgi:predicted DNA-binding protein